MEDGIRGDPTAILMRKGFVVVVVVGVSGRKEMMGCLGVHIGIDLMVSSSYYGINRAVIRIKWKYTIMWVMS